MHNRVKTILVSLSAVLVLVAGTVVGTNLVTAGTAPSPDVTVTFNYSGATGGTSVTTATFTPGTEADAELPYPTKPGVSFSGWFNTQSLLNGQRITTIEESDAGTLIAGFVPLELAQTLNLVIPTASCAQGGTCVVGGTGPGGGRVFYDAGSVQPWGRYLEMAPKAWSGALTPDAVAQWCNDPNPYLIVTSDGIGTGAANTVAIDAACTSGAGQSAADYSANGLSDWFLPSILDLRAMCNYSRNPTTPPTGLCTGPQNADFASSDYGFASEFYWSSSWGNVNGTQLVGVQNFVNGSSDFEGNVLRFLRVRPVRSF